MMISWEVSEQVGDMWIKYYPETLRRGGGGEALKKKRLHKNFMGLKKRMTGLTGKLYGRH